MAASAISLKKNLIRVLSYDLTKFVNESSFRTILFSKAFLKQKKCDFAKYICIVFTTYEMTFFIKCWSSTPSIFSSLKIPTTAITL